MTRNHDRIVIKRSEDGSFFWRYVSSNGRILCHSENYIRKSWCIRMAQRVSGGLIRIELP